MSRSSTYSRISSLSSQLGSETQVKKRRDVAEDLLSSLAHSKTRARLAREATPSSSASSSLRGVSSQRRALCQLWRVLVRNALMAAKKATSGRGKLTLYDVMLPYRFLCLCDTSEEDPQSTATKLSSAEILDLLKYCLNMLADEDAVAVAENDLLTMLHHLCSREDYVVYYRPHGEIHNILAELDIRLTVPEVEEESQILFLSAAKTFSNLLQTCGRLGIGMHMLVSSGIEVVSKWCEYHLQRMAARGNPSQALPFMYGAATSLIIAHPEQAIGPFIQYGRPLLRLAKRCFPVTQGFIKAALIDYFLAHLSVCQTAGRVQGLLPGDLGDVGSASMDEAEIESLFLLATSEQELEKLFSSSKPAAVVRHAPRLKATKLNSRQHSVATNNQILWSPPNDRQRTHLELCARLMACAQRFHFTRVEWNAMENPVDSLFKTLSNAREKCDADSFMKHPSNPYVTDPTPLAPVSDIQKSPWMSQIAKKLLIASPTVSVDKAVSASQSEKDISQDFQSGRRDPSLRLSQRFPILKDLSYPTEDLSSVNLVMTLRLICAFAEAFPYGECWSTSTSRNWITHVPEDLLENDTLSCSCCSLHDIAFVVYLVSNVLELHGGHGGDSSVQSWALLCLIRLTDCTAVICQRFMRETGSMDLIGLAWRRVWNIIMRSDCRYSSYTENAVSNSNGELVLILLTEIVRNFCADPSIRWQRKGKIQRARDASFVHVYQAQVWGLPAFNDALSVQSKALFDLVYVTLRHVGLSEQGEDGIDVRVYKLSSETVDLQGRPENDPGRRARLLRFALRNIESAAPLSHLETNRQILHSSCACVLALLGCGVRLSTTFSSERYNRLCVTGMLDQTSDIYDSSRGSKSIFDDLWLSALQKPIHNSIEKRRDVAMLIATKARSMVEHKENRSTEERSGAVSSHESGGLQGFALEVVRQLLRKEKDDGKTTEDIFEEGFSGSLSSSTSLLKVYLSIFMSHDTDDTLVPERLKILSDVIAPIFNDVVTRLPFLSSTDIEELPFVLDDVYGLLSALTTLFATENAPRMPRVITGKVQDMFEICVSLLTAYGDSSHGGDDERQESTQRSSSSFRESDFDSDSSTPPRKQGTDSDSDFSVGDKRKRSREPNKNTRRKLSDGDSSFHGTSGDAGNAILSVDCARKLAGIAVLLQPSPETCQLVAETLLWPCLTERHTDRGISIQEMDPAQGIFCLDLICRDEAVSHYCYNDDKESIVPLCCDMINLMRTASGPAIAQHLYGFVKCFQIVGIGESNTNALSRNDCRYITETLKAETSKSERRSLKSRPELRAKRLYAATRAFRSGRENFHREFDHVFATQFVIPALCDISEQVRFHACFAVGAALRVLEDQRRIVDSVFTVLPPLTRSRNRSKILSAFRRWYEDKDLGSQGKLTSIENNVWDDALLSFEASSLFCRGFIAGCTSDLEIFREILFDFVRLSAVRPDLEAICFRSCEMTALLRGFRSAEDMLQDECEWLVNAWLKKEAELASMPLLMTSPCLLRQLLHMGKGLTVRSFRLADQDESGGELYTNQLRAESAVEYTMRNVHLIVPLILLFASSSSQETSSAASGSWICDRGWKYLREVCDMLNIEPDDDGVKVLLKSHLPDITGYFSPSAHSDEPDSSEKATASIVLAKVETSLSGVSSYEKHKRRKAHVALRRILQLCGKHEHSVGVCGFSSSSCVNAMIELSKDTEEDYTDMSGGSIFENLGVTVTECILFSRAWIFEAVLPVQKTKYFLVLEVLFDLVAAQVRDGAEDAEIGFALSVILDILLEQPALKGRVLSKMKVFFTDDLRSNSNKTMNKEVVQSLFSLVSTLLLVHEESQKSFVVECTEAKAYSTERRRRSLGLVLIRDKETSFSPISDSINDDGYFDQTHSPLFEHGKKVKKETTDSIIGTYEVLELIVEYIKSLQVPSNVLSLGSWDSLTRRSSHHRCLSDLNKKFYAQAMMRDALQDNEVTESSSDVAGFSIPTISKRLATFRSSMHLFETHQPKSASSPLPYPESGSRRQSIDSFLMLAELDDLRRILRCQRKNNVLEGSASNDREVEVLARELLSLCGASSAEDIRYAASRCLGELRPSAVEDLSFCEYELNDCDGQIKRELSSDNFLSSVHAKAMELLTQYLKSPRIDSSLAAVETIKALLQPHLGSSWWRQLQSDECKQLLRPFRAAKATRIDEFFVSLESVASSFSPLESVDHDALPWCLEESLWSLEDDESITYEDWIRKLVCSLISCFYMRKNNSKGFFHCCLKMSSIEPEFAAAIFPAIIFDQLSGAKDQEHGLQRKVVTHRAENDYQRLSSCFAKLIESRDAVRSDGLQFNAKSVALAVNTLDMLRIVSQQQFLLSKHHKKNPRAHSSRSHQNQTKSNSRRSSTKSALPDSLTYNDGIEPAPKWAGVPFGVFLELDGLEVAKACIRAKRYASALFYVELYADNTFAGSTGALQRLSNEIIDYESLHRGQSEAEVKLTEALEFGETLQRCYRALQEYDAARAVDIQKTALQFLDSQISPAEPYGLVSSALDHLRRVDAKYDTQRYIAPAQIVGCLDDLGLKNIMRTYVEGVVGVQATDVLQELSSSDRLKLRDKWFEGSIHRLQWDETFFPAADNASTASSRSVLNALSSVPKELEVLLSDESGYGGLSESMTGVFLMLMQEDMDSCIRNLMRARCCLLQSIEDTVTPESVLTDVAGFVPRLQVLNDLEDYASGRSTPLDLASIWGLSTTRHDGERVVLDLETEGVVPERPHGYETDIFSLTTREIFLRVLNCRSQIQEVDPVSTLACQLWQFCKSSRRQGDLELANSALQRLHRVLAPARKTEKDLLVPIETTLHLRLEESKIMEARGDVSSAIRTGRLVVNHLNRIKEVEGSLSAQSSILLSEALLRCGRWMNTYKVEPAEEVLRAYLKPAAEIARVSHENEKKSETAARSALTFFSIAELSSNLFVSLSARVTSHEWKTAGGFVEDKRRELQLCQGLVEEGKKSQAHSARKKRKGESKTTKQSANKGNQDMLTHIRRLEKEISMMTTERKKIERSVQGFLHSSMESYGAAMSVCGAMEMQDMPKHIYRFVSLWFAHFADDETAFKDKIGNLLARIPSFRFVPLTYQVFSRIGGKQSFQDSLEKLVERMCSEHPYQCLVQLIALANGNRVGSGVDGRQANDYLKNVGDSKVTAAKQLISSLRINGPGYVSELIDSYTALVDGYIELAMFSTEGLQKAQTKDISFANVPAGGRLDRCLGSASRALFSCPPCMITKPPPVRPGRDYGDGKSDPVGSERVLGFQPTFSLTETGVHCPKIVKCIGANRNVHKQLVKGHDDIRQDAVMEQVFSCVNDLLKQQRSHRHSTSTHEKSFERRSALHRQLKLVTYGIVPLSPTCGVLEWVTDTMPFGDYLVDKGRNVGAHSRYYPGEWGSSMCAAHLRQAPADVKREAFDVICEHISPAFRFFFVERFAHSLKAWHTAKMTYTRSCAVSSIVGHMLGIGDRHCSNILVHEKTGEIVHIDFGIVFEQGRSLPVPETVPFRLTRDIVDGMGPCGTEGTFARAAEATVAVLRENSNALLTILSAVVADPLYRWSVNPVKALELQRADDEEVEDAAQASETRTKSASSFSQPSENQNEAATRALARIHEKLQGYEDGTSGECQSVEGQVQLLINSARDPNNLCAIFPGWSPWL